MYLLITFFSMCLVDIGIYVYIYIYIYVHRYIYVYIYIYIHSLYALLYIYLLCILCIYICIYPPSSLYVYIRCLSICIMYICISLCRGCGSCSRRTIRLFLFVFSFILISGWEFRHRIPRFCRWPSRLLSNSLQRPARGPPLVGSNNNPTRPRLCSVY